MMKSVKWFLAVVVLFSLVLGGSISTALASDYVTLQEIREEVKDGWHQTYESHGRTIHADIDIHVPDVEKTPIVKAGAYSFSDFQRPADCLDFHMNELCPSGIVISYSTFPYTSDHKPKELIRNLVMENQQAEGNPLTMAQAQSFAERVLNEVGNNSFQYNCYAGIAYSKRYIDKGGLDADYPDLDLNQPRTTMGEYYFYFHQIIQGIPVIDHGGTLGGAHFISRPYPISGVVMVTEDNYTVSCSAILEKDIMINDVPLLPFRNIKNAFESYIEKGVVRDIYRVDFGYMLFDDADNNEYILKPVWAMDCDIMWDAKKPTLVRSPTSVASYHLAGKQAGVGVYVDAQTGAAITRFETPESKTNLPFGTILTWDDIGGAL